MLGEYKIYCIGPNGHIEKRHDCYAPDDLIALDRAREICGPQGVEIWQSQRLVARMNPDGTENFNPPIGSRAEDSETVTVSTGA